MPRSPRREPPPEYPMQIQNIAAPARRAPIKTSNRKWYDIRNAAGDAAEIRIYDVIGWPFVTADQFIRDLDAITAGTINLRVNSPGGDIFEGIAIHNALERHPA